jgi:hypothetical protein
MQDHRTAEESKSLRLNNCPRVHRRLVRVGMGNSVSVAPVFSSLSLAGGSVGMGSFMSFIQFPFLGSPLCAR